MASDKGFSEWEKNTLSRITQKLGPDFHECEKCGEGMNFQTWPVPHYLLPEGASLSIPYRGAPGSGLFVKACGVCGFVELYCPDAIKSDE